MTEVNLFNGLDYIFLAIILTLVVIGCLKGFVLIFLSMLSFIASSFLSVYAYPYVMEWISGIFAHKYIEQIIAASLSNLLILIILLILSKIISEKIKKTSLSDIDRVAGGILGFIQGLILPAGICILFLVFNIDYKQFNCMKESKITKTMFNIIPYIPGEIMNLDIVVFLKDYFKGNENSKNEQTTNTQSTNIRYL